MCDCVSVWLCGCSYEPNTFGDVSRNEDEWAYWLKILEDQIPTIGAWGARTQLEALQGEMRASEASSWPPHARRGKRHLLCGQLTWRLSCGPGKAVDPPHPHPWYIYLHASIPGIGRWHRWEHVRWVGVVCGVVCVCARVRPPSGPCPMPC